MSFALVFWPDRYPGSTFLVEQWANTSPIALGVASALLPAASASRAVAYRPIHSVPLLNRSFVRVLRSDLSFDSPLWKTSSVRFPINSRPNASESRLNRLPAARVFGAVT